MCGDGANDAAALSQAQIGIAVSTAADVPKSAAGIVLTEPELGGILAAVVEGRVTFQRILTYTRDRSSIKCVSSVPRSRSGHDRARHRCAAAGGHVDDDGRFSGDALNYRQCTTLAST